jgi:hypothetical protein
MAILGAPKLKFLRNAAVALATVVGGGLVFTDKATAATFNKDTGEITVKRGDNLTKIARELAKYNVKTTAQEIQIDSKIEDPDNIDVGQKLVSKKFLAKIAADKAAAKVADKVDTEVEPSSVKAPLGTAHTSLAFTENKMDDPSQSSAKPVVEPWQQAFAKLSGVAKAKPEPRFNAFFSFAATNPEGEKIAEAPTPKTESIKYVYGDNRAVQIAQALTTGSAEAKPAADTAKPAEAPTATSETKSATPVQPANAPTNGMAETPQSASLAAKPAAAAPATNAQVCERRVGERISDQEKALAALQANIAKAKAEMAACAAGEAPKQVAAKTEDKKPDAAKKPLRKFGKKPSETPAAVKTANPVVKPTPGVQVSTPKTSNQSVFNTSNRGFNKYGDKCDITGVQSPKGFAQSYEATNYTIKPKPGTDPYGCGCPNVMVAEIFNSRQVIKLIGDKTNKAHAMCVPPIGGEPGNGPGPSPGPSSPGGNPGGGCDGCGPGTGTPGPGNGPPGRGGDNRASLQQREDIRTQLAEGRIQLIVRPALG